MERAGPAAVAESASRPWSAGGDPAKRKHPFMAATGRTRTALVGSGFIADVHLQCLRAIRGVEVTALCDPAVERARRLAARHRVPHVFAGLGELLQAGAADAAHVLAPPALHHELAARCLQAGLHVLVEKPLALETAHVDALAAEAAARGVVLAVNHNQTFHPALLALRRQLAAGRLGRLEHVALVHNVPLRQLQTGDVGHFMFQSEGNILLEQGVHLFSIVHALLGRCLHVDAATGPPTTLPNGVRFFDDWQLTLRCERGTAGVRMAFGRTMPETTVHAIGSDGAAFVDLARGACWLRTKTRWPDFADHAANLFAGSFRLRRRSIGAFLGYPLALFGLRFPDDPFLRGMRGSLAAFHAAVRGAGPPPDGAAAAAAVLRMCTGAAAAAGASFAPPMPRSVPAPGPPRPREVVVLGGAGFLGRHCVRLLREAGRPVTLLVRRPQVLPPEWLQGGVRVFAGDAADPAALQRAVAGADAVLHLATVAGDDPAAVETAMAAAVRAAASACAAARVRRIVYASSTAALWLGGRRPVTGAAGTDPAPSRRGAYARAKIAAERELAAARDLDVVIVRPAIVVGPGASAEHSGVGLWVRDNHCVGWGRGRNPLPLVLADDCARGLVAALDAQGARGRAYNLAGAVRLTAREYLAELRSRTGRDYRFHATFLRSMWLLEVGKHCVKVLARRPRQFPSLRDLRSRSFRAPLDCADAERDLGFAPERDRARFLQRLFGGAGEGPR
jgi:predicted dehydrogenase/nucleoside-diphosphate-sugar epimerase